MKRVALFEFQDNHYKGLVTLLEALDVCFADTYDEVHLFLSQGAYHLLQRYIQDSVESIKVKCHVASKNKILKLLQFFVWSWMRFSVIYINTLEPIVFYLLLFCPRGRVVVNLHAWGFLDERRSLRHQALAFFVSSRAHELSSLTYGQCQLLQKRFPEKRISMVSHGFYSERRKPLPVHREKEKIIFTVPGGLVWYRRDYELLVRVFSRLGNREAYELRFAGAPTRSEESQRVVELLERYKDRLPMVWYERYLSDEELEKEIAMADVMLSPSRADKYGGDNMTGTFFLMLEYGKPTLFPSFLKPACDAYGLDHGILYYEDEEDLLHLLERIVNRTIDLARMEEDLRHELKSKYGIRALASHLVMFDDR